MEENKENELRLEKESLTPEDFLRIQERFGVKYMTSVPTYTPKQRTDLVVYFDGVSVYRLYIYANKGWRYVNLT